MKDRQRNSNNNPENRIDQCFLPDSAVIAISLFLASSLSMKIPLVSNVIEYHLPPSVQNRGIRITLIYTHIHTQIRTYMQCFS